MDQAELPDLKEELHRKTFETLENLISNRALGKITNAEYEASINTMFSICSGLVDDGFFELISAASKEAVRDYSYSRTRLFKRGETLQVINRVSGKKRFRVSMFTCKIVKSGKIDGDRDELDTNAEAEEKVSSVVKMILSKGFKEIFH